MTYEPLHAAPPDEPCPDCDATPGDWCQPDCPRHETYADLLFEQAQAGDHPDGF